MSVILIPSWSLTTIIWFFAQPQLSPALLSAMPETVEQLEAYLAAKYSRPRDEEIAPRASSSSSRSALNPANFPPAPEWVAYHARLSAEPPLSVAPSTVAPTPSPGPATKIVPPHPPSPPSAPAAKRQKSGTPRPSPEVSPGSAEPSVFDLLNIFRRRWYLHRDHLIANILSATKDNAGRLDWVDFQPPFHTHLVRKALTLLPLLCPVAKGKRVMFVFLLEVLNEDSHGSPGRNPGPLAFFNVSKNPSPSAPKKAAASHGASVPTPSVSYSEAPLPGLRAGGKPAKSRRGVKTKKTLLTPGLSQEERESIWHAVGSQPGHPQADSLHPPVGASQSLRPDPTGPPKASGSGTAPLALDSRSPTPVPGPARDVSWFDSPRAPSVTLSAVEDLVETSRMVQSLHDRTPPPSLSPSSSAMDLDERARSPPPTAPLAFVSLMDYPWLLRHEMPASTVFLKQWCLNGLRNGVPASALECLIRTETAPMTATEKRQMPQRLRALERAVKTFEASAAELPPSVFD